MKMPSLKTLCIPALAAALLPAPSQAGFNGDTVTASFYGAAFSGISFGSTIVGPGVEFTGTDTDAFGQIWHFTIDVFDNGFNLSWNESTRAAEPNGGNIASDPNTFGFDLSFASSSVPTLALTAFSSSGAFSPMTSSLTDLNYPDSQSAHVGFSRLDATDSYTVTAVPEPETYALMLAGLGILGGVARRRKSIPVLT